MDRTKVNLSIDLLSSRVTKTNAVRIGAIAFRYAKGEPLNEGVAEFQAAFAFGYLKERPFAIEADPELKLCLVIDNYGGKVFEAPGNSIDRFNNMTAACSTIADCWDAITPPAKAIF